jgi:hypothetical protein
MTASATVNHPAASITADIAINTKKTTMHANVQVGTYVSPEIIIPITFTMADTTMAILAPTTSIDMAFDIDLDG